MTDVKLIKVDPVTGIVSFDMSSKTIEGIDELVQVVVLSLMNTPGKDVLHANKGGGIPSLIGYNISNENELFGEIAERISKSEREILEDQIGLDLDAEAKLKSINVKSISRGEDEDTILVTLQIVNELGRIAEVTI